jgi:hypothetical protein
LSERDGDGYRSDLGQARTEIFLQKGLDRKSVICPSGKITPLFCRNEAGFCPYQSARSPGYDAVSGILGWT